MFLVIFCVVAFLNSYAVKCDEEEDDGFGGKLIEQLTNDKNLDLPVDEEYEDLRAELLAYHTALANLTTNLRRKTRKQRHSRRNNIRRSLYHTPCWRLGGICIRKHLCIGPRYITQVAGCRHRVEVCCFGWNRYNVRDFMDVGIPNVFFKKAPVEFGGIGIVEKPNTPPKSQKPPQLAIILEKVDSSSN